MHVDAILFDLDGTLVHHSHVLLPEQLARWGHPRPLEAVDQAFQEQIQWFYTYVRGLNGRDDPMIWIRLYRRVVRQLGIDDASVVGAMARFFAAQPTPPLFEDVPPLLEMLADSPWPLGIITQRSREGTERFLYEHGLRDRFAVIVAGDDGFGRKPAPEPFHRALRVLDVEPERAVFVGDRIDDDCDGARAAGLRPFLIDRRQDHTPAASDPFTHLPTLLDLLDHLPFTEERQP